MQCPKCHKTDNIKWFLRYVPENEEDDQERYNTITILCLDCGHHQSYYLWDVLDSIFPEWSDLSGLGMLLSNDMMGFPQQLDLEGMQNED